VRERRRRVVVGARENGIFKEKPRKGKGEAGTRKEGWDRERK